MFCWHWYSRSALGSGKTQKVPWFLAFLRSFPVYFECYLWRLLNSVFRLPTPFSEANNAFARAKSGFLWLLASFFYLTLSKKFLPRRASLIRFLLPLADRGNKVWSWTLDKFMLSFTSRSSSVKTCLKPRRYLLRAFIYSNSISNRVTIILKLSLSTANSSHSLGILAPVFSDFSNFACFHVAYLLLHLFLWRFLNRLKSPGDVEASLLSFSWTMA